MVLFERVASPQVLLLVPCQHHLSAVTAAQHACHLEPSGHPFKLLAWKHAPGALGTHIKLLVCEHGAWSVGHPLHTS